MTWIGDFIRDEGGATSIEYAMLAAMFAVACIVAARNLGTSAANMWFEIDSAVQDASARNGGGTP